jgi:hypothetical protein
MIAELYWEYWADNTRLIESRLLAAVQRNHRQIMDRMAERAAQLAPKDTDAMSLSIYTVGPWGSTYAASMAAAMAAPGTRIVERNQISPELKIDQSGQRGVWLAAIDVPVTYSIFVHNGFYHILAQKLIPANPFLRTAFYEVFPDFMQLCAKDFREILEV